MPEMKRLRHELKHRRWATTSLKLSPGNLRHSTLSRANAIVALEGYVPTSFDRELDQGLISGRLTTNQAITLIRKRAIELRKKKVASKQNA